VLNFGGIKMPTSTAFDSRIIVRTMPGAFSSVDPKKPEEAAEAIFTRINAHEHDEETV
jgi:hypothetical protein